MQEQMAADGFVTLQGLLQPDVVDTMATSVNDYIARRGTLLISKHIIAQRGYIILGLNREPALHHLFEWVHGSHKLHDALAAILPQGYRYVHRNEISIDRAVPWHADGVPFSPIFAHQDEGRQHLINVGVYLGDYHNATGAMLVQPGRFFPFDRRLVERGCQQNVGTHELRPRKGDAVVFRFGVRHKSGWQGARRRQEPNTPVEHRSLLTIAYGPTGSVSDGAARAFHLRDLMAYDNITFGCGYDAANDCARKAALQNWRAWLSEGNADSETPSKRTRTLVCADLKWCKGSSQSACCREWLAVLK